MRADPDSETPHVKRRAGARAVRNELRCRSILRRMPEADDLKFFFREAIPDDETGAGHPRFPDVAFGNVFSGTRMLGEEIFSNALLPAARRVQ